MTSEQALLSSNNFTHISLEKFWFLYSLSFCDNVETWNSAF